MALKSIYEKFLASPEADSLAQESSLHYITTTTTHTHPEDIIKHLATVGRAIKKTEKTLNAVEGASSLCLDIETKLEFVSGGGPYLLGVDESFVVDRTVTFPTIHIVQFDSQSKISQIRVYWDQGSLLKQIEIIGPRNRGWPIRDGSEQMRLINSSVSAASKCAPAVEAPAAPRASQSNGENNKKPVQAKKHTRDPHGSLSLFDPSSPGPKEVPVNAPRSTYSTAKPRAYTYGDIFGDGEPEVTPPKPVRAPATPKDKKQYNHFEFGEGDAPPPSTSRTTKYNHFEFGEGPPPESPLKPAKVRNIFEHEEELSDVEEEKFVSSKKTDPKRASHFEFGEEPLEVEKPIRPRSTKHMSQWDFEDFVTPEKTTRRAPKGQEVRHFGWSDDEPETPQLKPRIVNPRRDAAVHFKLQDHPTPGASEKKPGPVKGNAASKRSGLYENHLYDEEPEEDKASQPEGKGPLAAVTNGAHRRKDFDSHWVMKDEPSPNRESKASENKHVASDRMKAVKMMESHWDVEDEDASNSKPVAPPQRTNRMSRNVNQRSWGFGDDEE